MVGGEAESVSPGKSKGVAAPQRVFAHSGSQNPSWSTPRTPKLTQMKCIEMRDTWKPEPRHNRLASFSLTTGGLAMATSISASPYLHSDSVRLWHKHKSVPESLLHIHTHTLSQKEQNKLLLCTSPG